MPSASLYPLSRESFKPQTQTPLRRPRVRVSGMERRKYPIRADDYELLEEIGHGVTAKVHRARCLPLDEIVAVKVLDLEKHTADLNNISREAQTMILINHPNLLKAHCSFANDKTLWVVMPYMAGGSCLHILKAAYTDGFEEVVIATLLHEVLKGLEYLHKHGHIHRDVKAGNILVDAKSGVKLGDFGVSASLFDSGDRQRVRNTFVGTPCWMAPEVMEQLHGYDFKADIWSFGITALELAHGHAPFSKFPPMKVLLMTLQNAPPSLNYERDKKFSKAFKQMVALCLVKDPSKRPAAHKLLKHNFFKQARSNDYIARTILEGLPPLADRIKALKEKEENLMAQKKMPDGEKEEISQSEYKRGISCWNFDIEDLKIQSALVQDEEAASEKDNSGLLNYGFDAVSVPMKRSPSASTASCSSKDENERENIDVVLAKSATVANPDPVTTPRLKFEEVDNDSSAADKTTTSNQNILQNGSHSHVNEMHNKSNGGSKSLNDRRHLEPTGSRSFHERKVSTCSGSSDSAQPLLKEESGSSRDQNQNMENCNVTIPPTANEDNDTKAKVPLVQQKGRFKVTSENIELEKAPPSPAMPKSQSLQALNQLPTSATNLPSPSLLGAKSNSISSTVLYQQLHYFLQDNFQKRDYILNAMKQVVSGDPSVNQTTNGEISQPPINLIERWSTLEVAQEREKELIQELTDLQSRFFSAQEELQKLKTGKPLV